MELLVIVVSGLAGCLSIAAVSIAIERTVQKRRAEDQLARQLAQRAPAKGQIDYARFLDAAELITRQFLRTSLAAQKITLSNAALLDTITALEGWVSSSSDALPDDYKSLVHEGLDQEDDHGRSEYLRKLLRKAEEELA